MRICISHESTYQYDAPAKGAIQIVRLTPRSHEGQHVVRWRLDISGDQPLEPTDDAMGNIAHVFTLDGPIARLSIAVEGEVETQDTSGIVRGTVEPFPPTLFLRETALTRTDAGLLAYLDGIDGWRSHDTLARLHALTAALHRDMTFDTDATSPTTSAAEAFGRRRGVCQDYAHIFLAAARHGGIPARYVSGHLLRRDRIEQEAGHAWAEAFVDGLGWVAFDPSNGICATERYIRVAVGLDYYGAAPIRGTVYGGRGETMSVAITVREAFQQRQSQS